MIIVTLLGKQGETIYINPHQIESIKANPDTIISMLSGRKYTVLESIKDIYVRIVKYRRKLGILGNED